MADDDNFTTWYHQHLPCGVSVIEQHLKDNPEQNVNDRDKYNTTALMWASLIKDIDAVTWLLHHGANVNLVDNYKDTALMYAAGSNDGEKKLPTIQTLIQRGADVGMTNKNGETALMKASDDTTITWLLDNMTRSQLLHQLETIRAFTGSNDYSRLTQLINERIAPEPTSDNTKEPGDAEVRGNVATSSLFFSSAILLLL